MTDEKQEPTDDEPQVEQPSTEDDEEGPGTVTDSKVEDDGA